MRKLVAHVSGKVQMAGYRSKAVTIAKAFDLEGYVRNLSDDRAKILAEGSDADLERFLKAIKIENTLIKVLEVVTRDREIVIRPKTKTGQYYGFVRGTEYDEDFIKELERDFAESGDV